MLESTKTKLKCFTGWQFAITMGDPEDGSKSIISQS